MQLQEQIKFDKLKQETEFNRLFLENNTFFMDNIEELQVCLSEQLELTEKVLAETSELPETKQHVNKLWKQLAESVSEGSQDKTLYFLAEIFNCYACLSDLVNEERKLVVESKNQWFKFSINNPALEQEINQLSEKTKQKLALVLESAKHPLLQEQLEFLQEKVSTENIQELQQAVGQLKKILDSYPQLQELNKLITKTNAEVFNMIRNKGFLNTFNTSATRLSSKITFIYDSLYEFLVQDLPLVINSQELETAKQTPDEPLSTTLDAQAQLKVKQMIVGRIEPTTLSKLLQFVGSGGTKPSIGSMINLKTFADEITKLSYKQLGELSNYGKALPKPITPPAPTTEQPPVSEPQGTPTEPTPVSIPADFATKPTTPERLEVIKQATKEDSGQMIINFRDLSGKPLPDSEIVKLIKLPKQDLIEVLNKLAEKNKPPPGFPTS